MIEDHTAAGEKMEAAAEKDGIAPPATMAEKEQAQFEQLQSPEGDSFDQAYLAAQVAAHDEAVALFDISRHRARRVRCASSPPKRCRPCRSISRPYTNWQDRTKEQETAKVEERKREIEGASKGQYGGMKGLRPDGGRDIEDAIDTDDIKRDDVEATRK